MADSGPPLGDRETTARSVDVVDLAQQAQSSPRQAVPGWYGNPDAGGLRYHDGHEWTDNYQAPAAEALTPKEMLWALCAAFGFAGGVPAAIGMPVLAFYFPLGLGGASVAMGIAAMTRSGETPWYGVLGLIAGAVAVFAGYDGYDQFNSI